MKIIHDPETCPLCEYSRRGLEPGRLCPECGVGLFPNTPVFELSISRGWIRFFIILGGAMGVFALIGFPSFWYFRLGDARLIAMGGAGSIALAWILDRIRISAVLSLSEIVLFRKGKVAWRMPYADLGAYTSSWIWSSVVLREKRGKRRLLPAWKRTDRRTIIAAIDDVFARYRTEDEVHTPTRAAGFSLRDRAASKASPQSEE